LIVTKTRRHGGFLTFFELYYRQTIHDLLYMVYIMLMKRIIAVLLAVLVLVGSSGVAYAQNPYAGDKSILFYDDTSCSGGGGSCGNTDFGQEAANQEVPNVDNARKVWEVFIEHGYSQATAATLTGYLWLEASFDPLAGGVFGNSQMAGQSLDVQISNFRAEFWDNPQREVPFSEDVNRYAGENIAGKTVYEVLDEPSYTPKAKLVAFYLRWGGGLRDDVAYLESLARNSIAADVRLSFAARIFEEFADCGEGDGGSSTSLVGESNEEKVWNYLMNFAASKNLDDGQARAVTAGIMGNLVNESGYDPFKTNGIYWGIYQTNADSFLSYYDSKRWHQYDVGAGQTSSAPQDVHDEALLWELDYLTQQNPRFTTDAGASWSIVAFMQHLSNVSSSTGQAGARGYADLFLVAVEGAFNSNGANTLADQQVIELASRVFPRYGFGQDAEARRNSAADIFTNYESVTPASGGGSCGSSGNGDANQTAIELSWPERSHNGRADWFDAWQPISNFDPNPAYYAALRSENGVFTRGEGDNCSMGGNSCDAFVASVMRTSGADEGFICCGAARQLDYLSGHPDKYEEILNIGNSSNLQPGDIRNSGGHIEMYIVLEDGSGRIASASHCDRTGDHVDNYYPGTGFRVFRKK
jgi:hypothetical protein